MKKIFLLITACLITISVWSNPIVPPEARLNELYFDAPNSWVMEVVLCDLGSDAMTHLYFLTPGGLVEVINFTYFDSGNELWFTDADLAQPLSLDPAGGTITLVAYYMLYPENSSFEFAWGNSPGAVVLPPATWQSISRQNHTFGCANGLQDNFSLDDSPTLQYVNDSTGTCSTMTGIVFDIHNQPVPLYDFCLDFPFTTDATGHFSTRIFSRNNTMNSICYKHNTYYYTAGIADVSYSLEPGATLISGIHLTDSLIAGIEPVMLKKKSAIQIFPNPVKYELTVSFSTDLSVNYSDLRLRIVDLSGREVFVQDIEKGLGVEKISIHLENGGYIAILSGNGTKLGSAGFIVCNH